MKREGAIIAPFFISNWQLLPWFYCYWSNVYNGRALNPLGALFRLYGYK